ncbi:MAG: hypothetical protein WCD86_09075 [Ktedonobacteraceae bacterium]
MKEASSDIFQSTMTGLEAGLQVLHITNFNLQFCDNDEEEVIAVFDRFKQFDQVPVRRNGKVVGLIERANGTITGQVKERMRPLNDSLLISAFEPLMHLISLMDMTGTYYLLVLGGTKEQQGIQGIVTRSDLLKLPIRLLAFTMVTHLEMLLKSIIQSECYQDEQIWLKCLSEGRRKNTLNKWEQAKTSRLEPPKLEYTEFCDKRDILMKLLKPGTKFKKDLEKIENLRNSVAHAGDYAETQEHMRQFIKTFLSAQYWIDHLTVNYVQKQDEPDAPNA